MKQEQGGSASSGGSEPVAVLDCAQLRGLIAAAGIDGAKDIINAFWRSTQTLLTSLQEQINAANYAEAAKTAHALKGSALNVGALGLSDAARDIEKSLAMGNGRQASADLDAARECFAESSTEFERILADAA